VAQIFSPTEIEEDELGGAYSTHGGDENIQYFNK
jgi:hypothetical protein